jgi:hypothetical protein
MLYKLSFSRGRCQRSSYNYSSLFIQYEQQDEKHWVDSGACCPLTDSTTNSPRIFPQDSYSDWIARWWRWINSIPKKDNPAADDTGNNCAQNQSSPAWFLVGTLSKRVERRCDVPAGNGIMFPLINTEVPLAAEPQKYKGTKDLAEAAKSQMDEVTDLEFHITAGKLKDWNISRVLTRPYRVTYIPDGIYEVALPKLKVDTPTETEAVSDGYWVFSEALTPGDYSFTFHGKSPTFENTVTYRLNVR